MLKADLFLQCFVMFSPAGKHESGTNSGGGEDELLRNQLTPKQDLSTHINAKSIHAG